MPKRENCKKYTTLFSNKLLETIKKMASDILGYLFCPEKKLIKQPFIISALSFLTKYKRRKTHFWIVSCYEIHLSILVEMSIKL